MNLTLNVNAMAMKFSYTLPRGREVSRRRRGGQVYIGRGLMGGWAVNGFYSTPPLWGVGLPFLMALDIVAFQGFS